MTQVYLQSLGRTGIMSDEVHGGAFDYDDIGIVELREAALTAPTLPVFPRETELRLQVGEAVGACGYPYGSSSLLSFQGVSRIGPIVHEGIISALAPYDDPSIHVDKILLDLRVAPGMSGSPVFRPSTGEVVGVVFATLGPAPVVGLAIPLSRDRVNQLREMFERKLAEQKGR
jgi:S1-C subfamily serine protease